MKRVWEHKNDVAEGFTKRYGIHVLVWLEFHETMPQAIEREKKLKKWHRAWKIAIIEENNPDWSDLFPSLVP